MPDSSGAVDHAPYAQSVAWSRVQKGLDTGRPVRVAMLDIDSTLTGDADTANRVRTTLEARGYLIVFNTSRTEEMVMTRASFKKSRAGGYFHRPPPHLGREDKRRVDVPPEQVEPVGLLDPDIIAGSTGTRVLVRQDGGAYLPDTTYGQAEILAPRPWRGAVFNLLDAINHSGPIIEPASIEYRESYENGSSDVYPPDYRIQVNFSRPSDRLEMQRRLGSIRRTGPDFLATLARRLHILDDSEPREDRYKAFVVPRWASKARAAHHIIRRLRQGAGTADISFEVLFVGDSYPDLHMCLVGGMCTNSTLLLVGHSRLMDVVCRPEVAKFAGISLRAVKRRLSPAGSSGYLRYRAPWGKDIRVIVGDEAYPGSAAVETVERFLAAGTA